MDGHLTLPQSYASFRVIYSLGEGELMDRKPLMIFRLSSFFGNSEINHQVVVKLILFSPLFPILFYFQASMRIFCIGACILQVIPSIFLLLLTLLRSTVIWGPLGKADECHSGRSIQFFSAASEFSCQGELFIPLFRAVASKLSILLLQNSIASYYYYLN